MKSTNETKLAWLKEHVKGYDVQFNINDKDEIVICGNCYIDDGNITELPYKITKVVGNFIMSGLYPLPHKTKLSSLKNMPDVVTGDFDISCNEELTSLAGGPSHVFGRYKCNGCNLTSLEGIASEINSYIVAYNNKITELSALENTKGWSDVDVEYNPEKLYESALYKKYIEVHKIYKSKF